MSVGSGESLEALASLMGVSEEHKPLFFETARVNFDSIFPSQDATSKQVATGLRTVLSNDQVLAVYSKTV